MAHHATGLEAVGSGNLPHARQGMKLEDDEMLACQVAVLEALKVSPAQHRPSELLAA